MDKANAITAFAAAQASMGAAIKSAKNPFFKNNYADLTDIQEAVYPAFHAQGFAIVQVGGHDEGGHYMETVAVHSSGTTFESRIYLLFKAGDMQSMGSAITYARRYGLMALSGIPTQDDDGNAAAGRQQQQKKEQPFNARETADKMIGFFAKCTSEQMAAQEQRSLDTIQKIEAASVPMSLEVKSAMDKAKARLEGAQ